MYTEETSSLTQTHLYSVTHPTRQPLPLPESSADTLTEPETDYYGCLTFFTARIFKYGSIPSRFGTAKIPLEQFWRVDDSPTITKFQNYIGQNYPKQNDVALFLLSMQYFFKHAGSLYN
jgi:hypothetical protein